jgi:cyanosortase A-associated protein
MTSQTKPQWGRSVWVASVSIACLSVLAYAIFHPQKRNLLLGQRPYQFPHQMALPSWQQLQSQALTRKNPVEVLAAHQYLYRYQGQGKFRGKLLQAQIFYLRYIEGNVSRSLNLYTPVTSTLGQKQTFRSQSGYAMLLTEGGKAYLSSCINARGLSTVTESQFAQNRYRYDLTPSRFLMWGLGQQDLLDRRCLLTALSIPIERPSSPPTTPTITADTQEILEQFWQEWQPRWQSQFPPS